MAPNSKSTDQPTTGVPALDDLIATVSVRPTGEDRFEGQGSAGDGVEATFGGHFLAQAVSAAAATVEPHRRLHSIHASFLRGGRPGEPFTLEVERVRDGRSFCSRRVRTSQPEPGDDGQGAPAKTQFELTASFAVAEDGPHHQPTPAPDLSSLPAPDSLPTYPELMRSLDPVPLPAEWAHRDYGLDVRTINAPWAPAGPSEHGGIRLWVRSRGSLPADDHHLQAALLAYQSDESLADCVAVPWGATWGSPGVVFVSLDHAMWFHTPFDLSDWLLFDQRPITVGHGRGLTTAQVWNTQGTLVASTVQEVLFRLGDEHQPPPGSPPVTGDR